MITYPFLPLRILFNAGNRVCGSVHKVRDAAIHEGDNTIFINQPCRSADYAVITANKIPAEAAALTMIRRR
jgi:hypothetical protein